MVYPVLSTDSQSRTNGIVVTPKQNVLVLVRSDLAELAGIWKITPERTLTKWIDLPAKAGLNGLAQDKAGNLYATDDTNGLIYRIAAGQSVAQIWVDSPLLKPQGLATTGFQVYGADGIKVYNGAVWVSNPSQSAIYRIAIQANGTAATVTEAYPGQSFTSVDDFAFDEKGNLYATSVSDNTVNQISPSGQVRVVLTQADGLDQPTAVAFGHLSGDQTQLYITNGSFYTPSGQSPNASLLRKNVGIKGSNR